MTRMLFPIALLIVAGCESSDSPQTAAAPPAPEKAAESAAPAPSASTLAAVLNAQPDEVKARYSQRHPQETLEFFGIEPGMTVMEALPGGGWYTKILLTVLGPDGHVIGVDYAKDMWPLFGFFSEEFISAKETWVEDWTAGAEGWRDENSASVSAFVFGSLPAELEGTADAALFIRALHNLNRFEPQGQYLSKALDDAYRVLKPGGVLGVVQHEAMPEKSDEWADGSRGYLKRDFVIARLEEAGFEYEAATEINANPKDRPGDDDVVWRLPPGLATSREDAELKARMEAIGESNRMTLRFRKPN